MEQVYEILSGAVVLMCKNLFDKAYFVHTSLSLVRPIIKAPQISFM